MQQAFMRVLIIVQMTYKNATATAEDEKQSRGSNEEQHGASDGNEGRAKGQQPMGTKGVPRGSMRMQSKRKAQAIGTGGVPRGSNNEKRSQKPMQRMQNAMQRQQEFRQQTVGCPQRFKGKRH